MSSFAHLMPKLDKIGQSAQQTSSRLLSLPGEIRNSIYVYTFVEAKKANVAFLLTCRLIYLEANLIAFGQIAFRFKHPYGNALTDDEVVHLPIEDLSIRYRNAVHTVYYEYPDPLYRTPAITLYKLRIFPLNTAHFRLLTKGIGCTWLDFSFICSALKIGSAYPCPLESPLFAYFLLNPRLKSHLVRNIYSNGEVNGDVVISREQENSPSKEPRSPFTKSIPASALTKIDWLLGLEMTLVEETEGSKVVVIKHRHMAHVSPVRLRVTLYSYRDDGTWYNSNGDEASPKGYPGVARWQMRIDENRKHWCV